MNGTIDPVLAWLLRGGLGLLFALAAWHKIRDATAFRAVLADYRLLPRAVVSPAAFALPAVEAGVAAGLFVPRLAHAAALAGAALLALYGGAMTINLVRGRRHIDCGCGGPAGRRALGFPLIARNALLATAAFASTLPVSERPLFWVDGFTLAAGLAASALLYAALDGLLAHAPRVALLRLVRHDHASAEEAARA